MGISAASVQVQGGRRLGFGRVVLAAAVLGVAPLQAYALLAGASPDSPAARVDANLASSPWAGVGSLSIGGGTVSGVVIGEQYVLTAAHAVAGVLPQNITFNLNAGADLSQQLGVSEVWVNPGYAGVGYDDLAVLRLTSPVAAGVPIYALPTAQVTAGAVATLVGYGASGFPAGITVGASPTVKRVGQNALDSFNLDDDGSGLKELYFFDFDGPTGSGLYGGGTLGNSIETTLGTGDSGGGAFLWNAALGRWELVGINTFVFGNTPNFGSGGGGVLTYGYKGWITSIAAVPEAETWATFAIGLGLLAAARRGRVLSGQGRVASMSA